MTSQLSVLAASEPAARFVIHLLAPPYTTSTVLPAAKLVQHAVSPPPLGAIVCVRASDLLETLAPLIFIAREWPWVALAVRTERGNILARALLEASFAQPERLGICRAVPGMDTSRLVRETVVNIKRRECPTAQTLAEYVARRVGDARLNEALTAQFAMAIDGNAVDGRRSVSAYSRFFSSVGILTAHDWRAVARLTSHLARTHHATDASAPGRVQPLISSKTALRYARRYLKMSWYDASHLVGWEWVLERALRTGGYVDT